MKMAWTLWRMTWWPSTCMVCGRWPSAPVCRPCAGLFASRRPLHAPAPAPLDGCLAAVAYAYPWDRVISRFKFHREPGLAATLAALMQSAPGFAELAAGCDRILPVPLSRSRLAERGYNQAWELIRALAQAQPGLGRKTMPLALERREGRADQHRLPRRQRLQNLRGAFEVPAQARPALQGRHLLLIDDVATTGATLCSAAQALRQAGAASVRAAVVAATPGAP